MYYLPIQNVCLFLVCRRCCKLEISRSGPKVIEPLKNALDNDYSQSRYNFMRLEDIS